MTTYSMVKKRYSTAARGCKPWECRAGWPDDPTLKPDIAALKERMEAEPEFAAQVTGDGPPTPGCRTPEGCRENGCLGWCDEYKPEAAKP